MCISVIRAVRKDPEYGHVTHVVFSMMTSPTGRKLPGMSEFGSVEAADRFADDATAADPSPAPPALCEFAARVIAGWERRNRPMFPSHATPLL